MCKVSEIKVGQHFRHNDEVWICTENDGFIFSADNVDSESNAANCMFIGGLERFEVEVIA